MPNDLLNKVAEGTPGKKPPFSNLKQDSDYKRFRELMLDPSFNESHEEKIVNICGTFSRTAADYLKYKTVEPGSDNKIYFPYYERLYEEFKNIVEQGLDKDIEQRKAQLGSIERTLDELEHVVRIDEARSGTSQETIKEDFDSCFTSSHAFTDLIKLLRGPERDGLEEEIRLKCGELIDIADELSAEYELRPNELTPILNQLDDIIKYQKLGTDHRWRRDRASLLWQTVYTKIEPQRDQVAEHEHPSQLTPGKIFWSSAGGALSVIALVVAIFFSSWQMGEFSFFTKDQKKVVLDAASNFDDIFLDGDKKIAPRMAKLNEIITNYNTPKENNHLKDIVRNPDTDEVKKDWKKIIEKAAESLWPENRISYLEHQLNLFKSRDGLIPIGVKGSLGLLRSSRSYWPGTKEKYNPNAYAIILNIKGDSYPDVCRELIGKPAWLSVAGTDRSIGIEVRIKGFSYEPLRVSEKEGSSEESNNAKTYTKGGVFLGMTTEAVFKAFRSDEKRFGRLPVELLLMCNHNKVTQLQLWRNNIQTIGLAY